VFQEMPAKQPTEANCHPRYSCSKPLLVDAIFIWFSDSKFSAECVTAVKEFYKSAEN